MNDIFYLMNKDNIIAKLGLTSMPNTPIYIMDINTNIPYINNLFFLQNNEILNSWIDSRRSPFHRKYMDTLFKATSIDSNYKYMVISKCISLNDTFWIKNEEEKLSWSDVSPYTNSFSKVLSDIAFGLQGYDGHTFISPSPELSTDGMSMKCWKRNRGSIYMYKSGGGLNELEFSQAYSEFFASQVSEALGIAYFARYDLSKIKDIIASRSLLFTNEKFGYRPIGYLFSNSGNIEDDKAILQNLPEYNKNSILYRQMLILDCLTFNPDRHSGNYGFIVDNDTNEILHLAPIFDNDRSLFCSISLVNRSKDYIIDNLQRLSPKTCISYTKQSNTCITKELYDRLIWISHNFTFKNHDRYPCRQDRVDMMTKIIRWRASSLIKTYDNYRR